MRQYICVALASDAILRGPIIESAYVEKRYIWGEGRGVPLNLDPTRRDMSIRLTGRLHYIFASLDSAGTIGRECPHPDV